MGNKNNKKNVIYWHPKLNIDIDDLVGKSGLAEGYYENEVKYLRYLFKNGKSTIRRHKKFESLKNSELYAMKIMIEQNIRVLFKIHEEENIVYFVFVHAFVEKNKKDYRKAIRIANNRLVEKGVNYERKRF